MKRQTAREVRATTKPESPKLIEPESQFDKLRELEEAIECRAYELFESRGCGHGQDFTDWLRAESEILQPLPIKVSEYQDQLAVEAEVPGFTAEEVEVSAEPRRLIISGRTSLTDREAENTFSREILAKPPATLTKGTFRVIDLAVEIDPDHVEARVTGEILNVTLPKRVVDKSSHAQASGS
jgi:HSP20 family molecular chaperone IbpA